MDKEDALASAIEVTTIEEEWLKDAIRKIRRIQSLTCSEDLVGGKFGAEIFRVLTDKFIPSYNYYLAEKRTEKLKDRDRSERKKGKGTEPVWGQDGRCHPVFDAPAPGGTPDGKGAQDAFPPSKRKTEGTPKTGAPPKTIGGLLRDELMCWVNTNHLTPPAPDVLSDDVGFSALYTHYEKNGTIGWNKKLEDVTQRIRHG